jgi:4-oxalomesaconate tautomerase
MQTAVPYMQLRGGSSKGIYFEPRHLPTDTATRDAVLLAIMGGGGDPRQVDGLGGADPLTSKIGLVSRSERPGVDLDYLFVQAVVGEDRVDITPNCGNILAGVGPFAIEAGIIEPTSDATRLRVYMENSGNLCELTLQTPNGQMRYDGDARIDGVLGTSAPVVCTYMDIAGSACGSLLPTGQIRDTVNGIEVSCVDNGMPVVVLRAADLGITGYEPAAELTANVELKAALEAVRLEIGGRMNLGDVTKKVVPKMCLIAPPQGDGHLSTRTFIPHVCHAAIGVLGAVSAATAAIWPGSVADGISKVPPGRHKTMSVEHPSGEFSVSLEVDESDGTPNILSAGLLRTARLLSRGETYVPASVWSGSD